MKRTGWDTPLSVQAIRIKGELEQTTKRAITELFTRIVDLSPVDTGQFKANWQVGVGEMPEGVIDGKDPTGEMAAEQIKQVMTGAMGSTFYLVNNLDYAQALEHGWSGQAPQGMVAMTRMQWEEILDSSKSKAE